MVNFIAQMSAFEITDGGIFFSQFLRGFFLITGRDNRTAQEEACFGEIGGDDGCEWKESL